MKRVILLACIAAALWTCIGRTAAAAPSVYPTAILNFEERGRGVEGFGPRVADVLFALLSAEPSLYLVDRADLKRVLDEQKLTLSGLASADGAVRAGQLTGAKLLVTGSVVELDRTLYLVAKIISTESSETLAASVKGKTTDDLATLVEELAASVAKMIDTRAGDIVPAARERVDRVAELKEQLGDAKRPSLWIKVEERHVGRAVIDPAAETELALLCRECGFEVIDHQEGSKKQADILIEGEAFSEFATVHGELITVKARVEIKAVDRSSGKLLSTDRQTEVVVDLAELVAGKTALQNAAAKIATRMLPKLASAP